MYAYHIALFLHILALMLATGATAVTKLAVGRRVRARTVGEALEWHTVQMRVSKLFPIALAVLVATGSFMLSVTRLHVWSSGFVVGGLVGVVLLFANGTFLDIKGKALRNVLERIAKDGADRPAPRLVPPWLVTVLPLVNTGIALSVVFDMATKPASVPSALGVIAVGIALSLTIAMRHARATVTRAGAPTETPTPLPENARAA